MTGQELPRLAARLEKVGAGVAALAQSRERLQAQLTVLEQQEAKLGGKLPRRGRWGGKT